MSFLCGLISGPLRNSSFLRCPLASAAASLSGEMLRDGAHEMSLYSEASCSLGLGFLDETLLGLFITASVALSGAFPRPSITQHACLQK